jgi:hypothetical protein
LTAGRPARRTLVSPKLKLMSQKLRLWCDVSQVPWMKRLQRSRLWPEQEQQPAVGIGR